MPDIEHGLHKMIVYNIMHVKDNLFLIAYENYRFDLVDMKELSKQQTELSKISAEEESKSSELNSSLYKPIKTLELLNEEARL